MSEALASDGLGGYFPLAEQFQTHSTKCDGVASTSMSSSATRDATALMSSGTALWSITSTTEQATVAAWIDSL